MSPVWEPGWIDQYSASASASLWRGVEAQHLVATMRLVDTLDEQKMLEDLLEANKPPAPSSARTVHYLIGTPFRYLSPVDSRFRRPHEPGVWYGAEDLKTACGETAYWRWRFLMDSEGLRERAIHTQHTFFRATANGRAIDLTLPPWAQAREHWVHGSDSSACQALSSAARKRAVQWIRYESARNPGGRCGAVLDPLALADPDLTAQQTWACKALRHRVFLRHERDSYEFEATPWGA